MNKSDSIGKLAEALSMAQGAMQNAKKDSSNPFYKSKYADLASVIDAVRRPLSDNGLSFSQLVEEADHSAKITTMLMHSSGEWLSSVISLTPTKDDPQGMGSAITYARRYALGAILGVASEEDDDGNAASEPVKETPTNESYAIVDGAIDEISKAGDVEELRKIHGSNLDKYNNKEITATQWKSIQKALGAKKTLILKETK